MAKTKSGQRTGGSEKNPNSLANLKMWKPGQSGNPKGMDPGVGHVRELAKLYTAEAIETLVGIMRDESASSAAQGAAANALLDRGWGRPDQSVTVEPGESLLSILDELERRRDLRVIEGKTIDADPQPNGDNSASGVLIEHAAGDDTQ